MMSEPSQILEVLKKYNQEHLLNFWSELNEDQKQSLQNQLNSIDFAKVDKLYKSLKTISIPQGEIVEPLDYFIKNEFSAKERRNLENQGTAMLKSGQYAVVTMAGGQGTRLGHKGPKGTFELNLFPKKESLFEILANKIKKANKRYNIEIPWYIMTSETNNGDTISFFESKNYFGYDKEKIKFFIQNKLPLVDTNGKILLSETYQVYEASNGNGNLFESLKENNMISDMKNRGIKWVFISGIDNILVKIADPIFLALTINNATEIGAKTIFKKDPYSRDWVFCKKNSKPAMLGYERITDEITNANIDGRFLYREINILCHLFSIDALEKISNIDLPYHRATKKNTYINEEGMKIVPEAPNSYKFETFIFDAFRFFDKITLLRVQEEKEFAPIKDPVGIYSPDAATKLYLKEEFNSLLTN
ncbi:MAG: UTP--glucose-1-phosphate uridylyltransferase [Clostridia bacterium]|nr:UTP--glucose-1-phosphate uridylyltransferase [Clostridia bacterium]